MKLRVKETPFKNPVHIILHAELQISDLNSRLEKLGYKLSISEKAKTRLVSGVETTNYGARPLKRRLEQWVDNEIATFIINDENNGSKLEFFVDCQDEDKITVQLI